MFLILRRMLVWLSRITHCRGFGIQSPTDYAMVRYVINEHWPYYQYDVIGEGDDWLTRKTGRLLMRLANWRQPGVIESDNYHDYLSAGCRKAAFGESVEMIVLPIEKADEVAVNAIYNKVDDNSLLIVDGLWRDKERWQRIAAGSRAVTVFDLYYCGILLFDSKRNKQYYIINF